MRNESINDSLLARLDIALMERKEDGSFALIGAPPRWFQEFCPESDRTSVAPQRLFLFLEEFVDAAERFWESGAAGPLRSGVWSESYAAGKEYVLEASALGVDGRKLLAIELVRSAYGDIQALAQKAREHGLDYDQLRRTQEELRRSEERYRDLFENASDLIQSCSPDGKVIYVNPAWCETLGYSADEAAGLAIFDIIHPASRAHCREAFERVLSGERVDRIDATFVTRDGRTIRLQGSSSCRFKDGKPVATRTIFRDITDQRRMEAALAEARDEALKSARLKAEFLANMSHEIRTPMNAIIGMTGLLLDTPLTTEQREFAETVRSSADALLSLINDILDFSKIEAGKLSFESMDFDLRNAVEGAIDLVAEAAQAKSVELLLMVDDDVPKQLRGDPGRVRQVLTNLLSNAVKFTGPGEVVIRIASEGESTTEAMLRFDVIDNGIGISEEAQKRIFAAFSQADGSTTRKYGGTGLGLAISKQLVQLMGGDIGVLSAPDRGSTFWFTARFEKPSQITPQPTLFDQMSGLRVLVVDDNATNRELVHHQLGSWGASDASAESGEEALRILRSADAAGEAFDIAILDMQMPGMDGLMLAREIKSDPAIARTRLLMMTSLGRRDESSILEAGVEICLTKPVKQSHLFDSLVSLAAGAVTPATREAPEAPGAEAQVAGDSNARFRILVAEDNIINQRVVIRQLQRFGYTVDAVANGLEVLEALDRIPYDVVLMDCQMPEMDGFEATKQIRRRETDARRTTIIAMTANALAGDRERCLAAGMDDYLGKPVKQEALYEILGRWTKRSDSLPMPAGAESKIALITQPTSREDIESRTTQPSAQVDESPTTSSPIDAGVLGELRRLRSASGSDVLSEVIELFLEDTPRRLASMREAVAKSNPDVLAREAHALKGSSGQLGARRMNSLCEILEEQGRGGTTDGAPVLLPLLEQEFERVRRALTAERESARGTAG